MTDQASEKMSIRREYRKLRDRMTVDEVCRWSEQICQRIMEQPAYLDASAVLCYMAFRNEVNLNNIMSTSWERGKKIYLPRMEEGHMEFFRYRPKDPLITNSFGISEPERNEEAFSSTVGTDEKVLVIMPGVVFDRECRRLGYGGGYYDRYFEEYRREDPRFTFLAAAYQIQIHDEVLPLEDTDVQPDLIITEQEIIFKKS